MRWHYWYVAYASQYSKWVRPSALVKGLYTGSATLLQGRSVKWSDQPSTISKQLGSWCGHYVGATKHLPDSTGEIGHSPSHRPSTLALSGQSTRVKTMRTTHSVYSCQEQSYGWYTSDTHDRTSFNKCINIVKRTYLISSRSRTLHYQFNSNTNQAKQKKGGNAKQTLWLRHFQIGHEGNKLHKQISDP